MTEQQKTDDSEFLASLKKEREALLRKIEDLEVELAVCEESIVSLSDPVDKGRPISIVKDHLKDNPGQTFEQLLDVVESHGGIPVGRGLRKRLSTSLSRSVREKTIVMKGELYYLPEGASEL
jgi:hypothetical protein